MEVFSSPRGRRLRRVTHKDRESHRGRETERREKPGHSDRDGEFGVVKRRPSRKKVVSENIQTQSRKLRGQR